MQTVPVLGVPLALTDYEQTMDWMDAAVARGERGYVCVAATHMVMVCQEDEATREAVLGSSLTVPDGKPLVWAINALGHRLDDRVYGPELMDRHCARAARSGTPIYLYGGRSPEALALLVARLQRAHPGLRVAGAHAPPFRELEPAEEDAVIEDINGCGAQIVWVGIGAPKQEKWMARMRERLEPPVLVGVGAAFDLHAGLIPMAPAWMQDRGLEWAYRLSREPRRLWRRYLRYNPRFVGGFLAQWARQRARRPLAERGLPRR
jgi:N-acetylglucosaminyldiphosphoundecaprenol N-acetyl-beta-D-mannosaminyltransferase